VVGLDIAEGMLRFARENHNSVQHWLCGDAEYLPLTDSSVQHIFSSLAIQWCSQLPQLFSELHRVLSPGGQLRIATLGPQTLYELRDAWKAVDHYAHVNHFEPAENLQAAMVDAGFDDVSIATQTITLSFADLKQLTHELKALGAHNMNSGQSGGLTGRARLKAFKAAYESFRREDGTLPATYEVYYLTASRST
jgi:malonyl-CoA O-methyltransferase